MASDKPIVTLSALVSLGLDPESAARVVREVNKNAAAIQRRLDLLNATKAQKSMDLWASSIKEAGGVEKLTEVQTRRLAEQLERLAKAGAQVPAALQPALSKMEELRKSEASAAEALKNRQEVQDAVTSKLGLGTGLAGVGAAAGGLLAVGAMAGAAKETYDLIKASAELADTISDLSGTYQVSTNEIQVWQRIQKDTGVSVDAIGGSIRNLSKILVDTPDKFKEWGMDVKALRELAPEDLLGAVGDRLQQLNATDRLAFIADLKVADELIPHLLSGFDELRAKTLNSINPLSPSELANLKETHDAINGLGTAWADMWEEIGNALGSDDQVRELFDTIRQGLVDLVKFIAEHREDLALVAKLAVAVVGGPTSVGSALVPVGSDYLSAKSRKARMAETLAREQALLGSGVTVDFGIPGSGKKPSAGGTARRDLAEEKRRQDELKKNAESLRQLEQDYAEFIADEANRQRDLRKTIDDAQYRLRLEADKAFAADRDRRKKAENAQLAELLLGMPPGTFTTPEQIAGLSKVQQLGGGPAIQTMKAGRNYGYALGQATIPAPSKDETMRWSEFAASVDHLLSSMGTAGSSVGKILGGIGGIGALFEKGGALSGGGGILKQLSGGLAGAFAAFDIGKTLFQMFHKTEAQKVAFDVGRDYGVKISDGLAQELAKVSKSRGRDVASLLSLDKIIGEAGGVSAFGLDKTIAKMHDLFSMISVGKMSAEEARKPFDALFGEVAQQSISKTTGLISDQARQLMGMAIDGGLRSEAVVKFQNEQIDQAMVHLDRLTKNEDFKIAGEDAGAFFGSAVVDAYNQMLDQGMSGTEIAEKLGPQIDALRKKLDEAGVGGGDAFDAMTKSLELFTNEITGPTASAFEDLTGLMASMYNAGTLNSSNFQGLAQQLGATYNQAVSKGAEAGMSEQQVFDALAPKLQTVWEAQTRLGAQIDPETQAMIDRALSEGKIGPEFMDPVVAAQDRTNEILEAGFKGLGADLSSLTPARRPEIPTEMSAYGGDTGINGKDLAEAVKDLGKDVGEGLNPDTMGKAINPGLAAMGQAVGDGLGGLADQQMTLNTTVQIQGGPIVGAISDAVNRNSPEAAALITAIAEKLKSTGKG